MNVDINMQPTITLGLSLEEIMHIKNGLNLLVKKNNKTGPSEENGLFIAMQGIIDDCSVEVEYDKKW